MNSQLAKGVKGHFDRLMRQSFPNFERTGSRGFGGLTYKARVDDVFIFVRLQLANRRDSFTFEVAASTEPAFPFEIIGSGPFRLVKGRFIRTRISRLLPNPSKMDLWWDLNDSSKADLDAILRSQSPKEVQKAQQRIPEVVNGAAALLFQILPAYVQETVSIYRQRSDQC